MKTNSDLRALADKIFQKLKSLERGDVLHHDAIVEVLHLAPHEGHWDHVMKKARRMLLRDRGIETWPAQGLGYRLLTTHEQIFELPVWRKQKQLSQGRKLCHALDAITESGEVLSVHERRVLSMQQEAARKQQQKIKEEMRRIDLYATKPNRIDN